MYNLVLYSKPEYFHSNISFDYKSVISMILSKEPDNHFIIITTRILG